jgi:hypothetical protein
MVFVRPRDNRFSPVNFELTYGVIGDEYYQVEKLVIGPHGFTYFIVGCVVAGLIGLILIGSIICCIIVCCRGKSKVDDVTIIGHEKLENDSRMGTTRNPGKLFSLYIFNRNVQGWLYGERKR